jgi:hypothetical protein
MVFSCCFFFLDRFPGVGQDAEDIEIFMLRADRPNPKLKPHPFLTLVFLDIQEK